MRREAHQEQWAEGHAEAVQHIIVQALQEEAICKVAHTDIVCRQQKVSESEIDKEYLGEKALTTALLGLIAEEALFRNRLHSQLGQKARAVGEGDT